MEEPWDELMGPSPDDLKKMLGDYSIPPPTPKADPPVRRTTSSAPPPLAVFNSLSDRWSQPEPAASETSAATVQAVATASRKAALREDAAGRVLSNFEIDDEISQLDKDTPVRDRSSLRQEALKLLEVADEQLQGSAYSVHRTVSGGFMAEAKSLGNKKRVPTALSGLKFTSQRKNLNKPYRDDPIAFAEEPKSREDYEYGEDDIVDVVGMESRSAASRPASESESNKTWSSRYSVDKTLLALSGGSVSSRKFLADLDKENERERKSARNMFMSSPHETRAPKVFGSGFSFRQSNVFGQQKVTLPVEPNLRSAYVDTGNSPTLPPANARTKTWQEQLRAKRRKQRIYLAAFLGVLVFLITLITLVERNNHDSQASRAQQPAPIDIPAGTAVFYVTSDVPFNSDGENKLAADFTTLSPQASFMVHLGNIQDSSVNLCQANQYEDVALLLQDSPLPTFVLPGHDDWNNCPRPSDAWNNWYNNFNEFQAHFSHNISVQVQSSRTENFFFEYSGVLFLGVHLVGGRVYDWAETETRNRDNFRWIQGMCSDHAQEARAIVIFGHAHPGYVHNRKFFESLKQFLPTLNLPVAYIHANSENGGTIEYQPFEGIDNIIAIQTDNGGTNPPLRILVGDGQRPFVIG